MSNQQEQASSGGSRRARGPGQQATPQQQQQQQQTPPQQQQQQPQMMYSPSMQPMSMGPGQGYVGRPMAAGGEMMGSPAGGPSMPVGQPPRGYYNAYNNGYVQQYYGNQAPGAAGVQDGQAQPQAGLAPGTSPGVSPSFGPAQTGVPIVYQNSSNPYYMYPVQPYYQGAAAAGAPAAPAAAATEGAAATPSGASRPASKAAVPTRERKPLVIIDPKTQKAVEIKAKPAPAPAKAEAEAAPAPAEPKAEASKVEAPEAAAPTTPPPSDASESKSQPNVMYAAVQAKLIGEKGDSSAKTTESEAPSKSTETTKEESAPKAAAPAADSAPAPVAPAAPVAKTEAVPEVSQEERQRKEAEAKANAEEQLRLAEEKKKALEKEDQEAEQKRTVEDSKSKEEEDARRAEEEKVRKAAETMRRQAGGRSAFGAGGRENAPAGAGAGGPGARGSGSFRSGAFGGPAGPPLRNNLGGASLPNPDDKPFESSETNKVTYTVAELLEFKAANAEQPSELANVNFDIIQVQSSQRPGAAFGGAPGRGGFQGGGNPRAAGPPGNFRQPQQGGGGQQWVRGDRRNGGRQQQQANAANAGSALHVAPIQRSENAWRPKAAEDEYEATLKKVKGTLNKLTLEKFDSLANTLLEIKMTSLKLLNATIVAIFDKALSEPTFGELYADLCRVFVDHTNNKAWDFIQIVEKDGKFHWTKSENPEDISEDGYDTEEQAKAGANKFTEFKRILINKCQEEFQKEDQIKEAEELTKKVKESVLAEEAKTPMDEKKVRALKLELQEANLKRQKIKDKVLGNIKFIGELYKKKILTEKVMHNCIVKLLFQDSKTTDYVPEEEDLECLCNLLTKIGSTLDASKNEKTKQLVSRYFYQLEKIGKDKRIDARYRFMVVNLLDLRKDKWQPRREELKAKKIEDVHKDAQREEQQKSRQSVPMRGGGGNMRNNNSMGNQGGNQRRGWDNNNRGGNDRGGMHSQMGGNTGKRLGVAVGGQMSQGYKLGGGARPTGAVMQGGGGLRGSSRPVGGGVMRPGGSGGGGGLGQSSGIAKPSLLGSGQQGGQRGGNRFNPPARGPMRPGAGVSTRANVPASKPAAPAPTPMNPEKLANSVKFTFTEYVEMQMLDELLQTAKELIQKTGDQAKASFVKEGCSMILEKKDAERRYVPEALAELFKAKLLKTEDFIQYLNERLEFLNDELMDNPLAFKYYSNLFSKLIENKALKVADLKACTEKFAEEAPHQLPKFMAAIFSSIKADPEVAKIVKDQAETFKLQDLIGSKTDQASFISDNDLSELF